MFDFLLTSFLLIRFTSRTCSFFLFIFFISFLFLFAHQEPKTQNRTMQFFCYFILLGHINLFSRSILLRDIFLQIQIIIIFCELSLAVAAIITHINPHCPVCFHLRLSVVLLSFRSQIVGILELSSCGTRRTLSRVGSAYLTERLVRSFYQE